LNGQRVKPGREIHVGARLEISKDQLVWVVDVTALSSRRGPAREAALLYQETSESLARREAELIRKREQRDSDVLQDGRPTKRDRRLIHRFKNSLE
jgi:ribosome-associated heat shock protein Hsp15